MLPSTSFVSAVCLLMITQAVQPELPVVEASIIKGHKITSTGACPPKPIVSWHAVTPPRQNSSLTYNVFCCGRKNSRYCKNPRRFEQKLRGLQCCQNSTNQPGVTLSCDITGALKDIYNPDAFPLPQTFVYTVIAVTDGVNFMQYSQPSKLDLQLRKVICTEPRNLVATVSREHVKLSWGMPPRMACKTFRFTMRYTLVPDGCSDDSIQKDTTKIIQYYDYSNETSFALMYSKLKPSREYIFNLTCDMFENEQSSPAVVKVRTLPRAPLEGPWNVELGNPVYYSKKRNITLTWKSPEASCPAKWNGKPVKIRIQYYPIGKSNHSASTNSTASNNENNVTTIDLNPSSSSAVIVDLSRYQEYAVKLAICNEAGCSPVTATVITAELEPPAQVLPATKATAGKGDTVLVIVIIVSTVGGIILFVIVYALVRRAKRKRSSQVDLHQARPPLGVIVDGIAPSELHVYSVIQPPLTSDKTDSKALEE